MAQASRAAAPPDRLAHIWIPCTVLFVATFLRFVALGQPDAFIWDEHYYVPDAASYVGGPSVPLIEPDPSTPGARIEHEATWVHPPLGKLLIASGIAVLGDTPLGWRAAAALTGTAAVGLLYVLALMLWASPWWAGLASLALALDGAAIVHSRIAMLDTFAATFLLAGFLLLIRARAGADDSAPGRWFGSASLFWAGACFGLSIACKWSGVLGLAFAFVLALRWHRTIGVRPAMVARSFLLVPAAVYVACYAPFWLEHGPDILGFITLQLGMLRHHLRPIPGQGTVGSSAPFLWPLLRGTPAYLVGDVNGVAHHVVPIGNLVLWWGFLISVPVLLLSFARERDWRLGFILGGYAFLFLPWLLPNRNQYAYYLLPAIPFMCLGLASAIRGLPPRWNRVVGATTAASLVLAAAAYLPLWIDLPVGDEWLRALQWYPGWNWIWL